MKRGKRKLKWQMMAFVIAVCVVVMLLFLVAFQNMKEIIVRQYADAAEQSVMAVAENIDYILQDIENQTNSILLNKELIESLEQGNKEEFIPQLNSYFMSSLYIEGIYIMTQYGYWHVGADIYGGQSSFRNQELKNTRGEIVWMPTRNIQVRILSGRIPKKCFSLGRKIIDVNSLEELGYMVVELNEETLSEVYGSVSQEDSDILIMDRKGRVITNQNGDFSSTLVRNHAYLQDILEEEGSGTKEHKEDGEDYVALYASLNRGNWKIVKNVPQSILYGDVEKLQRQIMLGSGAVFLVILLGGYLYFKRMTDPVTKIIGQMKKVEGGNLTVRVDTNISNEFGDLGESFNHMVKRVRELMEKVVASERNKKELELEVLHAQINPHFLYNTLSTIRFMAKIKGEESISSAISALTRLLRISISFGKEMIQLQEEVSYVDNYLLIQRLRFNQRFDYECCILPEHEQILIPKLILQPIVENSLIYGIDDADETGEKKLTIRIYTRNVEGGVEVVAQDNGPGMTKETISNIFQEEKNIHKFSKVGLNNVNQRIKLYCGEQDGLHIESEPGKGTRIIIHLSHGGNKLEPHTAADTKRGDRDV